MNERIVQVRKVASHIAGGCNGCSNSGVVFVINLRTISIRLCPTCYRLMRKQINALGLPK